MSIHYFSLTIQGQQMNVAYTPNKSANYGHFEFFSPHEPRRRILISETGYRSHFAPMWKIEETGSPEIYAQMIVKALMSSQSKESDTENDQQLSLF